MTEYDERTNMCLLAALMLPMTEQQQKWVRRGGSASEVFNTAIGREVDDKLKDGANLGDVSKFLRFVVSENAKLGVRLRYTLKCVSGRKCKRGGQRWWKPRDLYRTVVGREGSYLLIGKAKMTGTKLTAAMKRIRKVKGNEEKLDKYCVEAKGVCNSNHAVSVKTENGESRLFDNACRNGSVVFSIENLAMKMCDLSACYYVDLCVDESK